MATRNSFTPVPGGVRVIITDMQDMTLYDEVVTVESAEKFKTTDNPDDLQHV